MSDPSQESVSVKQEPQGGLAETLEPKPEPFTEANPGLVPSSAPVPASRETSTASDVSSTPSTPKRPRKPPLPTREEGKTLHDVLDVGALFDDTDGQKYSVEALSQRIRTNSTFRRDLALLHHVFESSRRLIVVTGAGVSVYAGIPDFRSQEGLFASLKDSLNLKSSGKSMFDASVYQDDKSTENFHATVRDLHKLVSDAQPTPFHQYLDQISSTGRLVRLYTQNIDCLDTDLPNLGTSVPLPSKAPYPKTIQLHGALNVMACSKCQWMGELKPDVFASGEVPDCPECVELDTVRQVAGKRSQGIGKLRPRIVLYNEANPDAEAIGSISEADITSRPGPDGLVVVGTSFKIPGVRRLVRELANAVHAARGAAIWINIDNPSPSQLSSREIETTFDLIVRADCQLIPGLMADYRLAFDMWKNSTRKKRRTVTAPKPRPPVFQITKKTVPLDKGAEQKTDKKVLFDEFDGPKFEICD